MTERLPIAERHRSVRAFLDDELRAVDAVFQRQLTASLPAVNRLCGHVARYRGKMLRPTMVLLSGAASRPDSAGLDASPLEASGESHRVLAAVCEMIHIATLVHDDVLDEADARRSGPTFNYLKGNEAAVLLGDYLISNAFHLCSSLGRPDLNRRIGATTNELCAGELLQVHHREDWSIDEATYFAIVERKTASLIGLCCELGAMESSAEAGVIRAMGVYGRRIGVAFQIQDDLLDLVGTESEVGKTLGRDLEKGKLTLPLILHFGLAEPSERARLLKLLDRCPEADAVGAVRDLLVQSGAVERARQRAVELVKEARSQLICLAPSPARDLLDDLAVASIHRRA